MDKCCKTAAGYVAALRAIYIIHQQKHWLSKGDSFYGNHLMFQRLYESAQKDLDLAAEKFIGLFGDECLDLNLQNQLLSKLLSKFNDEDNNLAVEKDFLVFTNHAYECFKSEGKLTKGLDDMIMSIASNREEAIYLLSRSHL